MVNLLPLVLALGATAAVARPSAGRLAPRQSSCSLTWNGSTISGTPDGPDGVCRYTIRYGTAARWANAAAATSAGNPLTSATQSEDCLYITLYVPVDATSTDRQPILAWLHGGAYSYGSDSAAGFDGAGLAANGGIIVAAIQYRLGVLGNLPPSVAPLASDPNFALRDVILALDTLRARELDFHGDKDLLSLGGQDSGASIIRALWGVPAAVDKFSSMILQSDPLSYGFASAATTTSLRSLFASQPSLSGLTLSTFANWQALSLSTLLTAQGDLLASASASIAGLPLTGALRPTWGTTTLPHDPTRSLFNTPSELEIDPTAVRLLITNTKNEAGGLAQYIWPESVTLNSTRYNGVLSALLGSSRATTLQASGSTYALPTSGSGDLMRSTLEKTITDGAWRCPARTLAQAYAAAGGTVFVGEFTKGVTYPTNSIGSTSYCTGSVVCHTDDIYPTFGSSPSPSSATITLQNEISAAWTDFINELTPSGWTAFTSTSGLSGTNVKGIGGGSVGSCPSSYWGSTVQWDWQIYTT
ncbi:hypothetical protein Q8F55_001698 [Vanrija albida]|uniref:Carboxylesterase type B domain-containing protein n=1 Tax=Vanrija albida TaxID=181172 RepID=A0ABR3Q7P1_9TREE